MLADTAHSAVKGQRWWQRFETDVELGKFSLSPLAIAGWTIVGGILASIVCALLFQSLWGLLIGLLAPFATRWYVSKYSLAMPVKRTPTRPRTCSRGSRGIRHAQRSPR